MCFDDTVPNKREHSFTYTNTKQALGHSEK